MTTLQLRSVNIQKQTNAANHHTSDYDSTSFVVRRGEYIINSFNFNRPFSTGESLAIAVETGPSPSVSNKTKVVMPVSTNVNPKTWSASRGQSSGGTVTVKINIPVDAVIGRYKVTANVNRSGRIASYRLFEWIVLFNPWNQEDQVYMSNEAERNEYVLNETGLIFTGSSSFKGSRRWDYAQFEGDILDIGLFLLDSSREYKTDPTTDVSKRNDPIYVGRVLSSMVNSNDDRGVLVGNWTGDYTGGQTPSSWSGSAAILRSWRKNGPVKFGQCWVYAGVLCTVLRCLGIPSRVITNFESAHDTNTNLLIEQYFDEYGMSLPSPDSVWNFHCWDEGWFTRHDLGDDFGGWQILDATPQELSDGSFRLGPTSQKAVKEGEVTFDFDTTFVFGEVNSDRKQYIKYRDGRPLSNTYTDSVSVGKFISTKAVGSFDRLDVTNDYKYPEGFAKEREIFNKARTTLLSFGIATMSMRMEQDEPKGPKPEITGSFKPSGEPQIGDDVPFIFIIKNPTSATKNIKFKLTVTSIIYNRTTVKEILTNSQSVTVAANKEESISLTVEYAKYQNALTPDNMIRAVAVCEEENGATLLSESVLTLKNPPMQLKVSEKVIVNKAVSVEVIFNNTIGETLKNCLLTLEGSGLIKEAMKIQVPDLKPNEKYSTKVAITPYKVGEKNCSANFSANKLSDVKAYYIVKVDSA
ncbi:protein-glutamine gamma-glutamyltransferase E [Xenopus laevis]|uniref:protein-glutamine gamma-glutamyltransferase n=2 Tax=Xenopus laevis TaxID=8355 RepID=A0A1L8EMD9_XENLA|nr:protein-glutamine gamma-glutamyltransferase E [Xenopus laevis]XP_041434001.1 protein-glutamine gamma-glutamyltransferase E [Xenopus laevis]OCT60526.1 hypothetical protein XELAEV_18046550mg [Xenopus laevis]